MSGIISIQPRSVQGGSCNVLGLHLLHSHPTNMRDGLIGMKRLLPLTPGPAAPQRMLQPVPGAQAVPTQIYSPERRLSVRPTAPCALAATCMHDVMPM